MQAVQAMVQQAMQYIDQTPDLETKIELIKTLNNVAAGKVSVLLTSFFLVNCRLEHFGSFCLSFPPNDFNLACRYMLKLREPV